MSIFSKLRKSLVGGLGGMFRKKKARPEVAPQVTPAAEAAPQVTPATEAAPQATPAAEESPFPKKIGRNTGGRRPRGYGASATDKPQNVLKAAKKRFGALLGGRRGPR